MEQGIVKNESSEEVAVMWDGMQVYFRPGQQRVFSIGVARGISNESDDLSLVEEEKEVIVAKVEGDETKKSEGPKFTTRTTKKGIVQYLKDGKICSKDEYEAR